MHYKYKGKILFLLFGFNNRIREFLSGVSYRIYTKHRTYFYKCEIYKCENCNGFDVEIYFDIENDVDDFNSLWDGIEYLQRFKNIPEEFKLLKQKKNFGRIKELEILKKQRYENYCKMRRELEKNN